MNSPRYLHTGGAFARALPQLRAKLLAAAAKVDEEQGWGLVSAAGAMWCGGHVYAKGWLVATQSAITFVAFSSAQAAVRG